MTCKSVHSLFDRHPCGQYVTFKYLYFLWYLTWYLSYLPIYSRSTFKLVAGLVGGFDWLVASILAVMKSVFVNIGHIVQWTHATVQSSGSQDVVREGQRQHHLGTLLKWISGAPPQTCWTRNLGWSPEIDSVYTSPLAFFLHAKVWNRLLPSLYLGMNMHMIWYTHSA